MTQDISDTVNWADTPLHQALVGCLPAFVKEPFSAAPRLDIPKLHKALGKSHETVYKWVRENCIKRMCNAQAIVNLASAPENAQALKRLGRTPPKVDDFYKFITA